MSLAHEKSPIAAIESALRSARVRYSLITPEEKQLLVSNASTHFLSQFRSNPSLHVPEELDLQRAPDSASSPSSIDAIKSDLVYNALLVRKFYYRAETTNRENRLAYRDREFDLGLTLLETSSEIFSRFWSDVTGEKNAKDEERTRTMFLRASIRIAINDFDTALQHIQGAIEYLDQGVVFPSEVYKGREWLLWGCKAEALDGKGCYDQAETHYRKALSLMPDNVKHTKYHVGLGRCLLSQGKTKEGRLYLQSFLIELEKKYDVDNKDCPLVGFTLYWLGNSCFDAGHLLEAIELHERAVLCLKSSLGETHSILEWQATNLIWIITVASLPHLLVLSLQLSSPLSNLRLTTSRQRRRYLVPRMIKSIGRLSLQASRAKSALYRRGLAEGRSESGIHKGHRDGRKSTLMVDLWFS
ncbi:hypothetical protein N7519_011434 [Penicillium mononematosum]|uniref:uncharacterized protein n=1 Tax=Penicillium mononematosum TaxID=268346 RepID=UPI002547FF9D|nr:uncharacterized protein N7519_011434 [Penicillium mononematosum]KAJ6180973.1 hypothetical protein N7519_011434 [Penicillium mononematosum]